jgi:cobyrinic acid a,c-diamide synthase
VLTSETYVQQCFAHRCHDAEFALVEGVMGLFDGAYRLASDVASTAHVARLLNSPRVAGGGLCSGYRARCLAIVHGYRTLDPRVQMAGVVLNRVGSDRHLDLLTDALASVDLPILGVLRRQEAIALPDRHLGLVPTAELPQVPMKFWLALPTWAKPSFDWPRLMPLLATAPPEGKRQKAKGKRQKARIAIAQDAAFSFYYPDALAYLRDLGVELVPWSPLTDSAVPEGVHGLYFGGGFPEMFGEALADNQPLRSQLRRLILAGMPTYAECGGLMYLAETLMDLEGRAWPMVGVLPTAVRMETRLTLGYRQATSLGDSPFLSAGQSVWGHEFHRSQVTISPPSPLYQLRRYGVADPHATEGWCQQQVQASYVHVHWAGCPTMAARWVQACAGYGQP